MIKRKLTADTLASKFTQWIGTPSSIIIHTLLFSGIFFLSLFGYNTEQILIILTTAVSLEAIYLSIFIQMSINRNSLSLQEVEKDVDEIAKDVDELQEDVEDIEGNVKDISKDIDEIQDDDDKQEDEVLRAAKLMGKMEAHLHEIINELEMLKKKNNSHNGNSNNSTH